MQQGVVKGAKEGFKGWSGRNGEQRVVKGVLGGTFRGY